jgi:hypothetical protein
VRPAPNGDGPPPALDGDSPRQRVALPIETGHAAGEVILPALPRGKVYWLRPSWTGRDGRRRWGPAEQREAFTGAVEREPAMLAARHDKIGPDGRAVDVTITHLMRAGAGGEDDPSDPLLHVVNRLGFVEKAESAPTARGAAVALHYRSAALAMNDDGAKLVPSKAFDESFGKHAVKGLRQVLDLDPSGEVRGSALKFGPQLERAKERPAVARFHEKMLQPGLEALYLALPGREVRPLEAWRQTRRAAVVLFSEDADVRLVTLELVCTYLGVLGKEAVVEIGGRAVGDGVRFAGGPVTGRLTVEVESGKVTEVRLSVRGRASYDDRGATVRCVSSLDLRLRRP